MRGCKQAQAQMTPPSSKLRPTATEYGGQATPPTALELPSAGGKTVAPLIETQMSSLASCVCGRTFNPDRLAVHMRGCKRAQGQSSSKLRPTVTTYGGLASPAPPPLPYDGPAGG
mmetsp:Transcript_1788/g.3586  ORF Transcript_1788/g.3586 Transcript_1788/m.3586 type:complete len:115 (-) Transcript_1788:337-681(-)